MKFFEMATAALSFFSKSTEEALSCNELEVPVAVFPDFVPYTSSTYTNNTYAHSMYNDVDNNEINLNRMIAVFAAIMAAANLEKACTKKANKKETVEPEFFIKNTVIVDAQRRSKSTQGKRVFTSRFEVQQRLLDFRLANKVPVIA